MRNRGRDGMSERIDLLQVFAHAGVPRHNLFGRDRPARISVLYVVDLVEELPHANCRTVSPTGYDVTQPVHVAPRLRLSVEELPVSRHGPLAHAEHNVDTQPLAQIHKTVQALHGARIIIFVGGRIAQIVKMVVLIDREIERTHPYADEIASVFGEKRQHAVVVVTVVLLVQLLEKLRIVVRTRFPANIFGHTPERRSVVVNQRPVVTDMENAPLALCGRLYAEFDRPGACDLLALLTQPEPAKITAGLLGRETGLPARLRSGFALDPEARQQALLARRSFDQHVQRHLFLQVGIPVIGGQQHRKIRAFIQFRSASGWFDRMEAAAATARQQQAEKN